jgi:hypothetical protein
VGGAAGHGTNTGYQRHLAARAPPCRPCKDAHTAYNHQAPKLALRLPPEAVDTVALALELELGGRVSARSLRWAAVIALRTAVAVLDTEG